MILSLTLKRHDSPPDAGAQLLEREHRPTLDAPSLAENPVAVPVRFTVDHPMEPGHFIESMEIVLETDPVPHKGTYRFPPANGRAGVSFPMRSGAGGTLKAIVTCSRHGRFVGRRELRIAGDPVMASARRVDHRTAARAGDGNR